MKGLSKTRAALAALIDPSWAALRLPGEGTDLDAIAERLEQLSPSEAALSLNPLIDLNFVAETYCGGSAGSALAVAVLYKETLLPLGVSPHPLIIGDLYRLCHPETAGDRRFWVERMLSHPDRSGRALVPILDPGHVLNALGMTMDGLASRGARSIGRLYLGLAAAEGITPHPLFDPLFVHAERIGAMPEAPVLDEPGTFLKAVLRDYLLQITSGGFWSPSAAFDEAFYRDNETVALAIEQKLSANGFHHFVTTGARQRLAGSPVGLDAFAADAVPAAWRDKRRLGQLNRKAGGDIHGRFLAEAKRRVRTARPPPVWAVIDGHLPDQTRLGQTVSILVHGMAMSPVGEIVSVELMVGEVAAAGPFQGFPRPDRATSVGDIVAPAHRLFSGFAIAWTGKPNVAGETPIRVRFTVTRAGRTEVSRTISVGSITVRTPSVRHQKGQAPTVAIAMATFNPPQRLLAAQIDSIRAQTLGDWQLVISDESTSIAARETAAKLAATDRRIALTHGPRRGFLGNFERALELIDRRSPFFALSDQDDIWHPNKLAVLTSAIERSGASMVYGDMRIVSEEGAALEPSFFSWRRRHGNSIDEILLANTISGAAVLARTELLADALPIPRFPNVFHDIWLALIASRRSGIAFVNQVLQDYVQHDGNVVGHHSGEEKLAASRFTSDRAILAAAVAAIAGAPSQADEAVIDSICATVLPALTGVWPEALLKEFLAYALQARNGRVKRRGLSVKALAAAAQRRARTREAEDPRTFLNIPGWLASGTSALAAVRADPLLAERIAARALQHATTVAASAASLRQAPHRAPFEKIRMDYRVISRSVFDVTMLIPELHDTVVFAGYLAKFHLARRLAEAGLRVRLALVDQVSADLAARVRILRDHPDLADLFDQVAVEEWGVRNRTIALAPSEVLLATTWWTAHLAHRLARRRFLYFIQEWETLTVPPGSWAALAEQSYSFPHHALLSTEILADFFRAKGIGAYSQSGRTDGARAIVVQHPAVAPLPDGSSEREKLIIFYARPEEHAARNLFEIVVAGLEIALKKLGRRGDEWRALGIGAARPAAVQIGRRSVEIRERAAMADYRRLLATARVGIAPMYAPHPSAVLFDMAASGLEVVTTSFETKVQSSFEQISPLIRCVDATPEGLASGIVDAVRRAEGSSPSPAIKWPRSWRAALGGRTMKQILSVIDELKQEGAGA